MSVKILGFPVCCDPFHSYTPVSGTGIASSTAAGTSALVMGDKIVKELSAQVDTDLSRLENSASHLETQVDSLDEVVLQNGRGLELCFRGQGALCMMLGETRCFSINQSGRIREGLAVVRNNLQDSERSQESKNQSQPLFSWLNFLLTAMAGPLILWFLVLTIGPCLFNSRE